MNIVDDFTRECLAVEIAYSFGSADVIRKLEDLAFERGFPSIVRFDNGSEFTTMRCRAGERNGKSNCTSSRPESRRKMPR